MVSVEFRGIFGKQMIHIYTERRGCSDTVICWLMEEQKVRVPKWHSCYIRWAPNRIYDSATAASLLVFYPFFPQKGVYSDVLRRQQSLSALFDTLFIYSSATSPSLMAGINSPAESACSLPIFTHLLVIFHFILANLIQALTLTIRLSMDDPVSQPRSSLQVETDAFCT